MCQTISYESIIWIFFSKIKLLEFFFLCRSTLNPHSEAIFKLAIVLKPKNRFYYVEKLTKIHRRIWLDLTEIRRSWTKLLDFKALQHLNGNRNEDEIPQCGSERTITLLVKCHPFGAIDDRCSQTEMADQRMRSPSMCARISLSVFYMCCDLS